MFIENMISYFTNALNVPGLFASNRMEILIKTVRNEAIIGFGEFVRIISGLIDQTQYNLTENLANRRRYIVDQALTYVRTKLNTQATNIVLAPPLWVIERSDAVEQLILCLIEAEIFPCTYKQEELYIKAISLALLKFNLTKIDNSTLVFANDGSSDTNNLSELVKKYLLKMQKRFETEAALMKSAYQAGLINTTPLAYAVQNNSIADVKALTKFGACDVNQVIREGKYSWWTLLAFCFTDQTKYQQIIRLLLKHGANANESFSRGSYEEWRIIDYVVYHDYNESNLNNLLKSGAKIDVPFPKGKFSGWTSLAYAVYKEKENLTKIMLEAKANPNQKIVEGSYENWSLISYAVHKNYAVIIQLLLKHGANPNEKFFETGWKNWTLLARSVYKKNISVVQELINAGAEADQFFPDDYCDGQNVKNYIKSKMPCINFGLFKNTPGLESVTDNALGNSMKNLSIKK